MKFKNVDGTVIVRGDYSKRSEVRDAIFGVAFVLALFVFAALLAGF
jgi:hypothetical protein